MPANGQSARLPPLLLCGRRGRRLLCISMRRRWGPPMWGVRCSWGARYCRTHAPEGAAVRNGFVAKPPPRFDHDLRGPPCSLGPAQRSRLPRGRARRCPEFIDSRIEARTQIIPADAPMQRAHRLRGLLEVVGIMADDGRQVPRHCCDWRLEVAAPRAACTVHNRAPCHDLASRRPASIDAEQS